MNLHPIDLRWTYAEELEGMYVPWSGTPAPSPRIVQLNRPLAAQLGLDLETLESPEAATMLTGGWSASGAHPLAQVYAGHQFGGYSPRLGDGRALLLGEIVDPEGRRWDLHLKGSGATPFSRGGDGKAVLGPVLREYLVSEAMHAMGVPTTRALAASTTGEMVMRTGLLPGAVLARIAASHIRVGTFQFFAARGDTDAVRRLADYAIQRHYPDLTVEPDPYLGLLRSVVAGQAVLVAQWLSVGFVHGVMNTDNVAISGETIDYGPCAFIDRYDPGAVFSSIDRYGRYAYARQPSIAQWNLLRFAETLLPLLAADGEEPAIERASLEVERFTELHRRAWLELMALKIGLDAEDPEAVDLIDDLLRAMTGQNVDFTLFFRALAGELRGDSGAAARLFDEPASLANWLARWRAHLGHDPQTNAAAADRMDRVNPLYIPRNHKVEEALTAAEGEGDFGPFEKLLDVVRAPFEEREGLDEFAEPAPPDFGPYRTFCGT